MIDAKEREKAPALDRSPAEPDQTTRGPETTTLSPLTLEGRGVAAGTTLLRLQQTAGNAAVAQLVASASPKRTEVREAHDRYADVDDETDRQIATDGRSAGGGMIGSAAAGASAGPPGDEATGGATSEAGVGASQSGLEIAAEVAAVVGSAAVGAGMGLVGAASAVGGAAAEGSGGIGRLLAGFTKKGGDADTDKGGAAAEGSGGIGRLLAGFTKKGGDADTDKGGAAAEGSGGIGRLLAGFTKKGGDANTGKGAAGATGRTSGSNRRAHAESERSGGARGGGGGGDAETAPAMPEVGQLGEEDFAEEPALETSPAVEETPSTGEGIDAAAGPIDGAAKAAESPGGGILDTVLDLAKSALRGLASRAGSAVRGAATAVRSTVSGMVAGARALATTATSSLVAMAKGLAGTVVSGIRSVATGIKQGARAVVTGALGRLQGIVSSLAGPVRGAISAVLGGGGGLISAISGTIGRALGGAFAALPARINQHGAELIGLVAAGSGRISALIEQASSWVGEKVHLVSDLLLSAVTWVSGHINTLLNQVSSWVSALPAVVRTAVQWLIDRILALARSVIAAVRRAAETWIDAATRVLLKILNRLRQIIETGLALITTWMIGRIIAIQQKLLRMLAAVERVRAWLIRAIRSRVQRVIAAISARINRAVVDLVVRLIGPQLRAAVAQTRLAFPNGMPAPPEIADAAKNAGAQVSAKDERGILDGLLRPEGDHIGISISASGSLGEALGVGGAVGASLDAVFDYRRNEVGFFLTPQVSAQVNVGEVGTKGFLNLGRSWGTVGSFGDKKSDVLESWGGWSAGVTYGAQASVAEGFGAGLQSGGTIYRSGSVNLAPGTGFSYTPLGAGTRTEPGQPIPTQDQPATPGTHDAFHMGEIRFPTGAGDVGRAQPAAAPILDAAAQVARDYPQAHTGARVTRVTVTGEASPPWRRPRRGLTPDQENEGLSRQRAEGVASALTGRLPDMSISPVGVGSRGATGAGLARDDPAPERQRALMTGEATTAGKPATTTGGGTTPPQTVPNSFAVDPSIPNPFTSEKAAWGWDTNMGIGGGGGAEAQVGVYGGVTAGFAFPIGKAQFSPQTMKLIRIAVGLYKLFNDIISLSPLAFLRDAVALGVWGVEELVGESVTTAVLDWAIPKPAGTGAA